MRSPGESAGAYSCEIPGHCGRGLGRLSTAVALTEPPLCMVRWMGSGAPAVGIDLFGGPVYWSFSPVNKRSREARRASNSAGLASCAQRSSTRSAAAWVRGDRRAALGEEHEPGAVVARVGAALHIASALKLIDRLGHRLLAHPGQLGEPGDRDAVRRHEREHVRGSRADVTEPRRAMPD